MYYYQLKKTVIKANKTKKPHKIQKKKKKKKNKKPPKKKKKKKKKTLNTIKERKPFSFRVASHGG